MAIDVAVFHGERLDSLSPQQGDAAYSLNLKPSVNGGVIQAWRAPSYTPQVAPKHVKHLHKTDDCCWLFSCHARDRLVETPRPCRRILTTYRGEGLRLSCVGDPCKNHRRIPAIFEPEAVRQTHTPMVAVAASTDAAQPQTTYQYLVTYVNSCGDESDMMAVSNAVYTQAGARVVLSNLPVPTQAHVVAKRLYRLETTWDVNQSKLRDHGIAEHAGLTSAAHNHAGVFDGIAPSDVDADYFLLLDLPVDAKVYADETQGAPEGLYTSHDHQPPPEDLQGITYLNTGSVAGFAGQRVYLSKRHYHHAFPDRNVVKIPTCIRMIHAVQNVLYIFTDDKVYTLVDDGGCDEAKPMCRTLTESLVSAPLCGVNSMATLDFGEAQGSVIFFTKHRQWAIVTPDAKVQLIASESNGLNVFDTLDRTSLCVTTYHDCVLFSSRTLSGALYYNRASGVWYLYRLSLRARAWFKGKDGLLYGAGITPNQVFIFNNSSLRLRWEYRWTIEHSGNHLQRIRSVRLALPDEGCSVRLKEDNELHFRVYGNNKSLRGNYPITHTAWVSIQRHAKQGCSFGLSGREGVVRRISFSTARRRNRFCTPSHSHS